MRKATVRIVTIKVQVHAHGTIIFFYFIIHQVHDLWCCIIKIILSRGRLAKGIRALLYPEHELTAGINFIATSPHLAVQQKIMIQVLG